MQKSMARRKNHTAEGFPERLRKLRTQSELSQQELADKVGLHYNQISRYEQGSSQPSADKVNKLAAVLGVSGDYLLNGEMKNAARADFEDEDLMRMFQAVQKLPDQDKFVVKRVVACVLGQHRLEDIVETAKMAAS